MALEAGNKENVSFLLLQLLSFAEDNSAGCPNSSHLLHR
jgi:hypothetical protein